MADHPSAFGSGAAGDSVNMKPETYTSSVAVNEVIGTVIEVEVEGMLNDVISGAALSVGVQVTVSISAPALSAASSAVTVMTFSPLERLIPLQFQLVVPEHVPLPPPLLDQPTKTTPTPSVAVPASDIELTSVLYVEDVVGELIVIKGAVVSNTG